MTYACRSGTYAQILAQLSNSCQSASIIDPYYGDTKLVVSVFMTSTCTDEVATDGFLPGSSPPRLPF